MVVKKNTDANAKTKPLKEEVNEELHSDGKLQDEQESNRELEALEQAVKAFEEKHEALNDKYLRLSAEFDNYRKRTLKEKSELIKTATEELLIRILPFVDDMERGMAHMDKATELNGLKEGMNLIYTRFLEFLKQQGVKEIEALNIDFNTDLHEAVTKIPVQDESMKGKVVDVVSKGYYLHEKVIRYPKVVIGE